MFKIKPISCGGKFLIIIFLTLTGCASIDPTRQMGKDTKVYISVSTDDLIYTQVVTEGGIQAVVGRIKKIVVQTLDEHGIKSDLETFGQDEAKLTIQLDTIETATATKPGPMFTVIAFPVIKINYTATLLSKDGVILFKFDGHERDESWDQLMKKVGVYVGKRVAKCYKP